MTLRIHLPTIPLKTRTEEDVKQAFWSGFFICMVAVQPFVALAGAAIGYWGAGR